jgi:hypothetical protein
LRAGVSSVNSIWRNGAALPHLATSIQHPKYRIDFSLI